MPSVRNVARVTWSEDADQDNNKQKKRSSKKKGKLVNARKKPSVQLTLNSDFHGRDIGPFLSQIHSISLKQKVERENERKKGSYETPVYVFPLWTYTDDEAVFPLPPTHDLTNFYYYCPGLKNGNAPSIGNSFAVLHFPAGIDHAYSHEGLLGPTPIARFFKEGSLDEHFPNGSLNRLNL